MNAFTLARAEVRLLTREWAMMVFAFVFPPLTMLVVAGAFGEEHDEAFGDVTPVDFYVAGYLGVPIAAIALIGLPVALASYRERDVLRRFQAFGVTTAAVNSAQVLVCFGLVVLAGLLVLGAAAPTYGIPAVARPAEVIAGFFAGTAVMLALGTATGQLVRTARGAQAIGLVLFFPMFLLSGGGPPPGAMGSTLRSISDVLPLTHAVAAIRDPWLDDGPIAPHLAGLGVWLVAGLAASAIAARRATGSAR